jgi:hypothetical protein
MDFGLSRVTTAGREVTTGSSPHFGAAYKRSRYLLGL